MARVVGESRLRARRRKRLKLYIALVSGGAVFVVGGFIALLWAPFWRVSQVSVSGASAVPLASIQQVASQALAGRAGLIFPKNNILLYPKQGIQQTLLQQFPTLASASVADENLHSIKITVAERQPAALWCGDSIATSSACDYMDASGFVFAPAAHYSAGAYQEYFGVLATSSPGGVGQYLAPGQLHSLVALVGAIAAKVPNDSFVGLWVEQDGDAHLMFASGFTVLFNSGDDTGDVFSRFSAGLTADVFASHALSDFEYLDLRFGQKPYYKLKSS
jgi:hypothetical protein